VFTAGLEAAPAGKAGAVGVGAGLLAPTAERVPVRARLARPVGFVRLLGFVGALLALTAFPEAARPCLADVRMPLVAGRPARGERAEVGAGREALLAWRLALWLGVPWGRETTMMRATKASRATPAATRPAQPFLLEGRGREGRGGRPGGRGPAGGGGIRYLAGAVWRGWYWLIVVFSLTSPRRSRMVGVHRLPLRRDRLGLNGRPAD
jgi:hypothetical protein